LSFTNDTNKAMNSMGNICLN